MSPMVEAMESVFLHNMPNESPQTVEGATSPPSERVGDFARKVIVPYLMEQSDEFREHSLLRQRGWNNPKGDDYLRAQRRNADQSSVKNDFYFHSLVKDIGEELHQFGNIFAINRTQEGPPKILDMCMAPGGFWETALKKNPGSQAVAFSLPVTCGGHKSQLPKDMNVDQKFLDVTMLASDMGAHEIPKDHPDAINFLPQQLRQNQLFDLVISLGLEHLNPRGTMVKLLHQLEAWDTAKLVWTFAKFSSIKLLKPKRGQAKRSSFYMIASKV
ncbi:hypothetical protein N7476_004816 [Penicillium atrosanguineum]|uniref:Ribosomal RNA methyltransferase FtsJ domain-containing protein n=1 Tax=Penicillium atrosanguineum TaxID=1132637 RepID=A0A9W9PYA1_9EURO|nr:hypothetical protein N7526_001889 [Penicillium atrosanguineum]KAJ5318396.1 hypothetical protein N7476_004816 [Penicillium atrosanguineum]